MSDIYVMIHNEAGVAMTSTEPMKYAVDREVNPSLQNASFYPVSRATPRNKPFFPSDDSFVSSGSNNNTGTGGNAGNEEGKSSTAVQVKVRVRCDRIIRQMT